MTAQSALARLASTFKVKLNEISYFFAPTLNKQMTDTSQEVEHPTGLDSIHTETEQKPQSVCPSDAGSFWHMPPSPEEGQERPFECHVHWTPPSESLITWYDQKYLIFLLFYCESEINHEHVGLPWLCWLLCEQILLCIWPQWASLIWQISSVCGLSLWPICQQLRLCVFLQFNILISPCVSGCWQLLQSVTFKKSLNSAPQDKYFCCSNCFLSQSIHSIATVRETPSTDITQEAKAVFQLDIFCACIYSLILNAFQGTINKN